MPNDLMPPDDPQRAIDNMWPRLFHNEEQISRHAERMDKFETAITAVRDALTQTEQRLTAQMDARITVIDDHLTAQDGTMADVREVVAGARSQWPQAALVFVSIAGTVVAATLAAVFAHVHF